MAIALTALIPMGAAIVFARSMVQQASDRFFMPEVRQNLERAHQVYGELAKATKAAMRFQADALSRDARLLQAVAAADSEAAERRLVQLVGRHPELVSLTLEDAAGGRWAHAHRGHPLDPSDELQLVVPRPLAIGRVESERDVARPEAETEALAEPPILTVVLATDRGRFDAHGKMGEFVEAYTRLEERRAADEHTYVLAFASLLGLTLVLAIAVGSILARGVTRRVSELASATRRVGAGDLSIRVQEEPRDEIGDLGSAFNRMLGEVEASRDRIEYLSRLASWQEMARRLAHEIKNPLTPIQLAVQEVHQRLTNLPPEQRRLLDVTLEIVESEVQTLRRLVGEFSEFARLPESSMEDADILEFLRELADESSLAGGVAAEVGAESSRVEFELPAGAAPGRLDKQLMRRVFINLVRNAIQAGRDRPGGVSVRITGQRAGDYFEIWIDDDGPGVPERMRSQIFEPYVTTKSDGTGLGLAIVKKIVIEHKGQIEMRQSPRGGARVRLLLPLGRAEERTPSPNLRAVG